VDETGYADSLTPAWNAVILQVGRIGRIAVNFLWIVSCLLCLSRFNECQSNSMAIYGQKWIHTDNTHLISFSSAFTIYLHESGQGIQGGVKLAAVNSL
jgi:hypothetical protein